MYFSSFFMVALLTPWQLYVWLPQCQWGNHKLVGKYVICHWSRSHQYATIYIPNYCKIHEMAHRPAAPPFRSAAVMFSCVSVVIMTGGVVVVLVVVGIFVLVLMGFVLGIDVVVVGVVVGLGAVDREKHFWNRLTQPCRHFQFRFLDWKLLYNQ